MLTIHISHLFLRSRSCADWELSSTSLLLAIFPQRLATFHHYFGAFTQRVYGKVQGRRFEFNQTIDLGPKKMTNTPSVKTRFHPMKPSVWLSYRNSETRRCHIGSGPANGASRCFSAMASKLHFGKMLLWENRPKDWSLLMPSQIWSFLFTSFLPNRSTPKLLPSLHLCFTRRLKVRPLPTRNWPCHCAAP